MNRIEAERRLKQIFGIEHFYDEQWKAIERILKGERILMIERTGFGKSLCYQFPATQFDGITVIFSPLIALMRDQVRSLSKIGIPAAYINSEQSPEDNTKVISDALKGLIKILYIAPERQENQEWIEATRKMDLSMVVIDEAHTISTWGHEMPYYIQSPEGQTDPIPEDIRQASDIRFIDPCMGSGHVLVYAFDLFTKMYEEEGEMQKDIPGLILTNNIFGIDIDPRCYQLASFALTMKARAYYSRYLRHTVQPNVIALKNIDHELSETRQRTDVNG